MPWPSERLVNKQAANSVTQNPVAIALMVAVDIGLHNIEEGLAIGGAVVIGEFVFGSFLIVGFTLHNTTAVLAIFVSLAKLRPKVLQLIGLGVVAVGANIVGTWIGGFGSLPIASVLFLSVGAGSVFQVILALAKYAKNSVGARF